MLSLDETFCPLDEKIQNDDSSEKPRSNLPVASPTSSPLDSKLNFKAVGESVMKICNKYKATRHGISLIQICCTVRVSLSLIDGDVQPFYLSQIIASNWLSCKI